MQRRKKETTFCTNVLFLFRMEILEQYKYAISAKIPKFAHLSRFTYLYG
ncbi:MAG: hypothetical protein ACI85O_003282 [Saprospiraceae bacterium]|jgi:hypothetical protein